MKSKVLLFFVVLQLMFFSCVNPDKVEIGDIKSMTYRGVQGNKMKFEFEVPVKNESVFKVQLHEIDANIKLNRLPFGKLTKTSKTMIPAGFTGTEKIVVNAEITNVTGGVFAVMQMFTRRKIQYEINGNIVMKMFLYKKNIPFNRKGKVDLKKKR